MIGFLLNRCKKHPQYNHHFLMICKDSIKETFIHKVMKIIFIRIVDFNIIFVKD
jgi:hypothetical protein